MRRKGKGRKKRNGGEEYMKKNRVARSEERRGKGRGGKEKGMQERNRGRDGEK